MSLPPEITPEALLAHSDWVRTLVYRLVEAVLALKEPYRTCVLLRYFEELPPREIGERVDRSVHTVRSQLARGLVLLRAEFDAGFGDQETSSMAFLPLALVAKGTPPGNSILIKVGGDLMTMKKLAALLVVLVTLFVWRPWAGGAKATSEVQEVPGLTAELIAPVEHTPELISDAVEIEQDRLVWQRRGQRFAPGSARRGPY